MIKPHIKYWKHGLWECVDNGYHSFDKTPEAAYLRFKQFMIRMRVEQ